MARAPTVGDVLYVILPTQTPGGHEQVGRRPAIIAGLPDKVSPPRYPLFIIVPMTTTIGAWVHAAPALYPIFQAGTGGLRFDSVALIDQLRSLDPIRVVRRLGSLSSSEYEPIRLGIEAMCDMK